MRKACFAVLLTLLLLVTVSACAIEMSFPDIRATVTLPDSTYDAILTPANLEDNKAFIENQGMSVENLKVTFESEGILMQAWNLQNNTRLVLTALEDVDSNNIFNINDVDETVRKEFRLSHTNGSAYGLLGYNYMTASWLRYNDCRFLTTKYTLKENGELSYRGYQRRTIYNGYTITMDWQVYNRTTLASDNKTLDSIMKTFKFTEKLPTPPLPCKLELNNAVPTETNTSALTLKGTTNKKATVTAVVNMMGSTETKVYTDTATSKGVFSLPIVFPSDGVYYIMLTIEAEGALTLTRNYSVTYKANLLPVNITSMIPTTLVGDTLTITGSSVKGVKVQCEVNGKTTSKTLGAAGTFSFKIDTSTEGTYTILLTFSKSGLATQQRNYTCERTFGVAEKEQKIRDTAIKPAYATLSKNTNRYDGAVIKYTAYITDITEAGGQTVIYMALTKKNDTYSQEIVVTSETPIDFKVGDKVTVYGTCVGLHYTLSDGGTDLTYPKLSLLLIEAAE